MLTYLGIWALPGGEITWLALFWLIFGRGLVTIELRSYYRSDGTIYIGSDDGNLYASFS